MAKFILEIETGNDAMRTSRDISTALNQVALLIRGDSLHYLKMMSPKKIMDVNGNTIGTWSLES
jgi:hypothetical protein